MTTLNTVYNLIYEYADKQQAMINPRCAFLVMGMTEDEAKETLAKGILQQKINMMVIAHVTGPKRYREDTDETNTLSKIAGEIVREVLTIQQYLSNIDHGRFKNLCDYQKTTYMYLATILRMPEMLKEPKLSENEAYMMESIKKTIDSKNN